MRLPALRSTRDAFAYETALKRVGDLGLRAALFRGACLVAISVVLTASGVRGLPWVVLAVATVGTYLSISSNYHQGDLTRESSSPREPIARWSLKVTLGGKGRLVPDVPGSIEAISYIPLASIGPWLMTAASGETRVLVLAFALAWIGSALHAVFVDPPFYNPDLTRGGSRPWVQALDNARRWLVGPLAASIALAVCAALPPWPVSLMPYAVALCIALGAVQLRIRETDRILTAARSVSAERERGARRVMGQECTTCSATTSSCSRVE